MIRRILLHFLLSVITFALSVISFVAGAENYPYRTDALWIAQPDHADWLYKTGEAPEIDIRLYRRRIPQYGVEVVAEAADDLMAADEKGTRALTDGQAKLRLRPVKKPGFRDLRLTVKIDGATYRHHVKVGFSPEKIEPYTRMPSDFDEFWRKNLDELAKTPLKYTITPAPRYSTDKIDAFLVKLTVNRQGQAVYGYLTMPKDAKPGSCPIVMCPPGAGIKTIKNPMLHKYYAENGCIRFEMEIHGLNPEMTEEQFLEIAKAFSGKENGYLCNGLDNRDNYYMRRVYLACVRAIDFLTTLPQWNGRDIGVQGGSQGGALAIVTAALDPRVTAVAAFHPALSDMAAFKAGRADGYPHFSRIPGSDTPEKLSTMAYYDVVNFARRLKCPVFMTWGYNDNTCAPTTSYAVYNVITAPKEALLTPVNEHWTSDTTERAAHDWLKARFAGK